MMQVIWLLQLTIDWYLSFLLYNPLQTSEPNDFNILVVANSERQSLLPSHLTKERPSQSQPQLVFEAESTDHTGATRQSIRYPHLLSTQRLSSYQSCVVKTLPMALSSTITDAPLPPKSPLPPPRWWSDHNEWNMLLRELRHNPCFMRPITAGVFLVIAIFWIVISVLRLPTMVLGLLLSPLLNKFYWVVEFWYPTGLGKQLHFWMIRLSGGGRKRHGEHIDANRGYHSRCIETRIELIPQRVYIHPLPQFMDNLGYIVVCLPPPSPSTAATPQSSKEVTSQGSTLYIDPSANDTDDGSTNTTIVALLVDCGDAKVVLQQVDMIRELFYHNSPINIQSILSTHKHHDHTAGNLELMSILAPDSSSNQDGNNGKIYGSDGPIRLIFGGAADQVPGCNYPLANGDLLPLPKAGLNDMNTCIEIETIATPAHTRGSVAYLVRPKMLHTTTRNGDTTPTDICLFTGDTIFSAGGGVPFEADTDTTQEESASKMTANNYIKASAATYAVERCFAEVLFRTVSPTAPSLSNNGSNGISPLSTTTTTTAYSKTNSLDASIRDRIIILPGHEYSQELLARQLSHSSSSSLPLSPNKWKNFEPSFFFETVSQYYIALHRRSNLPISSSGTLLMIPTTLSRELYVNPHLRSLRQRGKTIVIALKLWNRYFAKEKVIQDNVERGPAFCNDNKRNRNNTNNAKTRAQEDQWNLNSVDLNEPVFTTVYASDLDTIIEELRSGQIDTTAAAIKLSGLKLALEQPVVGRRAIPGTFPSSRAVYRGLVALTLIASAPTALTRSDSYTMKLPEPITHSTSTDHVCISKRRLISVLLCLGLLDEIDGKFIVAIIEQLWKEVRDVSTKDWKSELSHSSAKVDDVLDKMNDDVENNSTDAESMPESPFDECELGALKWVIYGIPAQNKSQSFFSKYCTPCSKMDDNDLPTNPTHTSTRMKRHGGELVRHDVFTCKLCRSATGCPLQQIYCNQIEENDIGYMHQIMTVGTTADQREDEDCHDNDNDDDESTTFIEVSPTAIPSIPGM